MSNISNLDPKYYHIGFNPQHTLPTFDEDQNLNMLVEIPTGSINKYEYATEANIIKLDRVNPSRTPYPFEYGLIPQTWDEDNDLLDIMCLTTYPTFPGCLIAARIIGVCYFVDGGEIDDKIISVPADDFHQKHIKSIDDVSIVKKQEIEYYWTHYKDLISKLKNKEVKTEVKGWGNIDDALTIIKNAQERYQEKFKNLPQ